MSTIDIIFELLPIAVVVLVAWGAQEIAYRQGYRDGLKASENKDD